MNQIIDKSMKKVSSLLFLLLISWTTHGQDIITLSLDELREYKRFSGDDSFVFGELKFQKNKTVLKKFLPKGELILVPNLKLLGTYGNKITIEGQGMQVTYDLGKVNELVMESNGDYQLTYQLKSPALSEEDPILFFFIKYDKYLEFSFPNLIWKDNNGVDYSLSNFKGKKSIVFFIWTGLDPSWDLQGFSTRLSALKKQYEGKDILFFSVSHRPMETHLKLRDKYGLDFTLVESKTIATKLSYPKLLPTISFLVINKDGKSVFWHLNDIIGIESQLENILFKLSK